MSYKENASNMQHDAGSVLNVNHNWNEKKNQMAKALIMVRVVGQNLG